MITKQSMTFLHNISTVARYEATTLRRSWFFRLFSLGSLFIITIFNIAFFSPIGNESWQLVAVPSSLPYFNLYLINIGQAIVVIFLASDFLKRDKKLDTNEVLYTRSMSNLEYITGKTWGVLRLFLGLDIIVLAIGMLMNITSKSMTIDFASYFSYLFLIAVPTIVFSLGLSFLLMSVIRNQALTFLLLLGFAALDILRLWYRVGSLFDYIAFGLPMFKSGIVGFDNLDLILNQRLLYLFLGLSFVLATVLLFKRLPQSKTHSTLAGILMTLFLLAAFNCGYKTYSVYKKNITSKKQVIETNRLFSDRKFAYMVSEHIKVIHDNNKIDATTSVVLRNDNQDPLTSYLLSLNPGLKVITVSAGTKELKYKRTGHIIEVEPLNAPLLPGQSDSLTISYSGDINEAFCYPDYTDNVKKYPYRLQTLSVNKRQAFLGKEYVLLTPEAHWYPVASLNYYPDNPARIKVDFTRYSLDVDDRNGLIAVSQGTRSKSKGIYSFAAREPLTGLTLAIGNYRTDSLTVDSITYRAYYIKGHDYYKKDLSELKDTIPHLISGIMNELQANFSTSYPFGSLSLVEVPVEFYSYPRKNTQTRSEVQPSLVLLPEKLVSLDNAGFRKRIERQKRRMLRDNQVITDKEIQVRVFNDFMRNTFISGENFTYRNGVASNEPLRYRLGPSFYFFKNNFYSSEYPVLNSVFESHLQHLNKTEQDKDFWWNESALSESDRANLILRNMTFKELLARNPSDDTLRIVLTLKGDWLFNYMRSEAGLREFKPWFAGYINENRFRSVDIRKFNDDFAARFGKQFYNVLTDWFNGKGQPGFVFDGLKASEIVVGDRSRYQVVLNATNPEPVGGLFYISVRTGASADGGLLAKKIQLNASMGNATGMSKKMLDLQGRGMDADDISKIVFLAPNESKKIGIVVDGQPRELIINTLFGRNIPGEISLPVNDILKNRNDAKEFTGEENLGSTHNIYDRDETIIDNEDSGFSTSNQYVSSPLKKILGIENNNRNMYLSISTWRTPEYWQPIVLKTYYGKYIRSAVYTKAGTGDRTVTWKTFIKDPGYYDLYCYVGKSLDRSVVKNGSVQAGGNEDSEERNDNNYRDMHYRISHANGTEEITLDYANAEGGWNNLGRYYLNSDTAKVVMTNKSTGKIVIADAVRWVRQK